MARASGSEREDTVGGVSGLPEAPRMLINSVSGEVMMALLPMRDALAKKGHAEVALPSSMGTLAACVGRRASGTSMRRKPLTYTALACPKS